ncbi:MAG: FHA domain-containing protein [Pseudomonadota bacterium]
MPKLTLSFKGRLIDVFHLKEDETIIGRNRECGIFIDSLAISPRQAMITRHEDACHLEALDEEFPVQVNHKQTESVGLQHGDIIQVGKHTLTFSQDAIELAGELQQGPSAPGAELEEKEEDSQLQSKSMLQIMNGDNFGRVIPLIRNMTRIGRVGSDCAMIARRDSGYYISYLEGPAPPLVNNQPIGEESQLLTDGDMIKVGNTEMQFHS